MVPQRLTEVSTKIRFLVFVPSNIMKMQREMTQSQISWRLCTTLGFYTSLRVDIVYLTGLNSSNQVPASSFEFFKNSWSWCEWKLEDGPHYIILCVQMCLHCLLPKDIPRKHTHRHTTYVCVYTHTQAHALEVKKRWTDLICAEYCSRHLVSISFASSNCSMWETWSSISPLGPRSSEWLRNELKVTQLVKWWVHKQQICKVSSQSLCLVAPRAKQARRWLLIFGVRRKEL